VSTGGRFDETPLRGLVEAKAGPTGLKHEEKTFYAVLSALVGTVGED